MLVTCPTPYCFRQNSMPGKEYMTHHISQKHAERTWFHMMTLCPSSSSFHAGLSQLEPLLSLDSKAGFKRDQIFCVPFLNFLSALPVRPVLQEAPILLHNSSVQISKNIKNKLLFMDHCIGLGFIVDRI